MQIREVHRDDAATLDAIIELVHDTHAVDAPWFHPWSKADYRVVAEHGMDGEPPVMYVGEVDGQVVAHCDAWVSDRDNQHLAWLKLSVHPEQRRRGYGSALLDHVVTDLKGRGRTTFGMDGWESEQAIGFAARHGFEQKAVEVTRRQHLREVDGVLLKQLLEEAREAASSYELVRIQGRTSEEDIDQVVEMVAAINDQPFDGLDIEHTVFSRERVWAYEDAQALRNHRLYRLAARHKDSGEWAGNTVVIVKGEFPTRGYQHDTSVARAHRGHRLGALLKLSMVEWLAEAEPQLETISTTNAESNSYMISINEAMGYRVMGRALEFQKGP